MDNKNDISHFVGHVFGFFENLAGFFLNEEERKEELAEKKVKIGVSFVGMIQALFQVVYLYSIGLPYDSLIICTWFFSTGILLLSLKFFMSFRLFSHLYLCTVVLLILAVNFDAGMGVNPSLMWFCIVPAFSIFMVGMRWGIFYTGLSITLSYFSFILAPKFGYSWNEFTDYHMFEVGSANLIAGPLTFFAIYGYTYWKRHIANLELEKEREELRNINLENKKLISILFHDMGNNLTSAYLRLSPRKMKLPEDFPNLRNYEIGFKNIELMKELLNHVREQQLMSNVEEFPLVGVDLKEIVDSSLSTFEKQITDKKLRLDIDLKISEIDSNKTAFQFNVFNNLLSNAIKFTPSNGTISLKSYIDGGYFYFVVENPGGTIDENIRKEIFKISRQATSEGTAGEKGSGFGLAIAHDVCQKLGGELILEDTGGKVCFSFRKPLLKAA